MNAQCLSNLRQRCVPFMYSRQKNQRESSFSSCTRPCAKSLANALQESPTSLHQRCWTLSTLIWMAAQITSGSCGVWSGARFGREIADIKMLTRFLNVKSGSTTQNSKLWNARSINMHCDVVSVTCLHNWGKGIFWQAGAHHLRWALQQIWMLSALISVTQKACLNMMLYKPYV